MKCTALSQRSLKDLLILSGYVTFSVSVIVFYDLFTNSHAQRNITSNIYILSFWCRMYYIVSKIYIGKHFLKKGCYFQQIIFAVAKESRFPITLHKEHQKHKTFNTVTPNTTPNQIKQNCTKKWSFPFRISSLNVTKSAGNW